MKSMFSEITDPAERLAKLKEHADASESTFYMKPLSQAELDQKCETLVNNFNEISRLDDELKGIKAQYKEQTDPLKLQNKELGKQYKTRQEEVRGLLFHFADHEEGMMNTYNESGEFISSRRLKPEEKQGRLFVATN